MSRSGELFRIPERGKIAGVCAGVAERFGIELWLVRIIWVSGVFLLGPFFVVAYVAAWFILDAKASSSEESTAPAKHYDAPLHRVEVKTKVWQSGEPPRQAMKDIRSQFDTIEQRLRSVESYVTSPQYILNKEISKL